MRIGFLPVMLGVMAFSGCAENEHFFLRKINNQDSAEELSQTVREINDANKLNDEQRIVLYAEAAYKGKECFKPLANPFRSVRQERAVLSLISLISNECARNLSPENTPWKNTVILAAINEATEYLLLAVNATYSSAFEVDAANQLICLAKIAEALPQPSAETRIEDKTIYPALVRLAVPGWSDNPAKLAVRKKLDQILSNREMEGNTANSQLGPIPRSSEGLRKSQN